MSKLKESVGNAAEQWLLELKETNFDELSKHESSRSKNIENSIITVWCDTIDANSVRIVVQIYERNFLGIGRMSAKGFIKSSDQKVRELTNEELYDFL
ncbi:MAG: hypothetical protein J0M12_07155 [Deltaproteobacteria bacterium]|nr:hypothetical protein [Deltaproteobacteria bacterium]